MAAQLQPRVNHLATVRPPMARPTPPPTAAGNQRSTAPPAAVSCSRVRATTIQEEALGGTVDGSNADLPMPNRRHSERAYRRIARFARSASRPRFEGVGLGSASRRTPIVGGRR
jgi:hypothetical protein